MGRRKFMHEALCEQRLTVAGQTRVWEGLLLIQFALAGIERTIGFGDLTGLAYVSRPRTINAVGLCQCFRHWYVLATVGQCPKAACLGEVVNEYCRSASAGLR
ncbi:conserved protein of unknown function [Pseudomonas marincola]|uniref:Uncharacterized protein n=1 Tax=Pseudomonas marincola TaxID=437900 RepID=A0A653E606_9PSED|nr:conserved protein of unknown function [Pseudomonas marincola]